MGAAYISSNGAPGAPRAPVDERSPAERAAARKQAADAAMAAQAAEKAEAERAARASKRNAVPRTEAEEAAAEGQAAATAAEEEAATAASWTVAWSTAGDAPYFYNQRSGEMTWVEPRKGVLTKDRLKAAQAEAERAQAESSFPKLEAYATYEKLNAADASKKR